MLGNISFCNSLHQINIHLFYFCKRSCFRSWLFVFFVLFLGGLGCYCFLIKHVKYTCTKSLFNVIFHLKCLPSYDIADIKCQNMHILPLPIAIFFVSIKNVICVVLIFAGLCCGSLKSSSSSKLANGRFLKWWGRDQYAALSATLLKSIVIKKLRRRTNTGALNLAWYERLYSYRIFCEMYFWFPFYTHTLDKEVNFFPWRNRHSQRNVPLSVFKTISLYFISDKISTASPYTKTLLKHTVKTSCSEVKLKKTRTKIA